MNINFRSAIAETMHLLKSANVKGATAVIQRALRGEPASAGAADVRTEPSRTALTRLDNQVQAPYLDAEFVEVLERTQSETISRAEPSSGFVSRTYAASTGRLAYKLYVPANHTSRQMSLVLMLHGCTQNPDDFALGTQMNGLADEFGLIVAYPHQPRSGNAQGCWNWFDPRHQQRGSGEPAALAGLAQELAAEFNIPTGNVFAAGLSAGGAMAEVLAVTYPEVFSAVGVHSGLPYGSATDVMSAFSAMKGAVTPARQNARGDQRKVRKIIFHGSADKTVHVGNSEQIFRQAQACSTSKPRLSQSTINGRKVTRTSLNSADGTSLAEHWLIHGSGHAWSGASQGGSYTDKTGPDASREMVRFFLAK